MSFLSNIPDSADIRYPNINLSSMRFTGLNQLISHKVGSILRTCRYLYRHRQYRHIGTFFSISAYRLSANIFSAHIADICGQKLNRNRTLFNPRSLVHAVHLQRVQVVFHVGNIWPNFPHNMDRTLPYVSWPCPINLKLRSYEWGKRYHPIYHHWFNP